MGTVCKIGHRIQWVIWHSESVLHDPSYHQKKHNLCMQANVKLLSIYEDEWRDKRNIVESMIRHRLKLPAKTWDARKLSVVELRSIDARDFFEANHLEGHVKSVATIALKDPTTGTILAAMSLRRPFHKKYSSYLEAGRCCTLAGHSVRGWLGKLTNAAKKYAKLNGVTKLMTYVDSRVGSGLGYESAGWVLETEDTSPRFWWTDFEHRYNRFKHRADRARNLSQSEVAAEAGVVPIWGCSNSLFVLDT